MKINAFSESEEHKNDCWPACDLEFVSSCPVCGRGRRHLLYADLRDEIFRAAQGSWKMYQCEDCYNAWLDPRPTAASIGRAYASYYTHDPADHPIVRRKGGIRTIIHDAMNDYRNTRYGLEIKPSTKIGRWIVPLFPSIKAAIDSQCRHLPRLKDGTTARLLDVGFGNGGFLRLAEQMGWQAEGIDFDQEAVAVAISKGLKARCANAGGLDLHAATFDVITISHVIEHVYNPIGVLEELFKALKPGGMLWIETPNLDSKGHSYFGRNWRGLEPPRHLVLFGGQSLIQILEKCGFEKIERKWRGLCVFDVYPASEALKNGGDPLRISRQGKPPLREILAELEEMLVPRKREFITLVAWKPCE